MTKIIQTFWNASKEDILLNAGGYVCPEIHWMSWAFSCLQLRKFYPRVEMYTNQAGKDLFELLEIPYTKIHTTLEDNEFMKNLMPELWAYSKIHTYSIQEEPFLHIDGDVFIWKPFEEKLLNSPLIAQCLEDNMEVYIKMIKTIDKYIPYKPDWFEYIKDYPKAYNAGVIGGTDYHFFKEYANRAYDFYPQNADAFREMKQQQENVNGVNLIFEQYLYYVLAEQQNKAVSVFTDTVVHTFKDNDYFINIRQTPAECQYLHYMGSSKRILYINSYINYLMQTDYPEQWRKIISVFEGKKALSSYMQHLLQLEKNDRNTNILNPFLITKPLENAIDGIAHLKAEVSETNICKCLKNSFREIGKMDNDFLNIHPVLQEVAEYQRFGKEFCKQDFNKYFIPYNNNLFSFYKGKDLFQDKEFLNHYILVNPYHDIYITQYNWNGIGSAVEEEDFIIRETNELVIYYLNLNNNTREFAVTGKLFIAILENLKQFSTTIGDCIQQYKMTEKECLKFMDELWQLQMAGIVYFSTSAADFIPSQTSTTQLNKVLDNYNTHINKSLKFILNYYKIENYDKAKITSLDSVSFFGVPIGKVLQLVKELNFDAVAIKTTIDAVKEIPVPALLLLESEHRSDYLYVVLLNTSETKVTLYNPETDRDESYTHKYFDKLWSKKIIVLRPKML